MSTPDAISHSGANPGSSAPPARSEADNAAEAAMLARASAAAGEQAFASRRFEPLDKGQAPVPGRATQPTLLDHLINRALRIPRGMESRIRIMVLRAGGAHIGAHNTFRVVMLPQNPWDLLTGEHVTFDDWTTLLAIGPRKPTPRLTFGSRVYVNRFTMFAAAESLVIGDDIMIGPHCFITDHDHGVAPGVPVWRQPLDVAPTRIGSGAWIGAGVTVLKGVTIGDNAVIAAGAVVNRDIPADTIAGGVPAKVLRAR